MTDHIARRPFLCNAISALSQRGIDLVITSNPGEVYHFEMDGRPVTEFDVIVKAAMLDAAFFVTSEDNAPDREAGGKTVAACPKLAPRRDRARHRERSNRQSAR